MLFLFLQHFLPKQQAFYCLLLLCTIGGFHAQLQAQSLQTDTARAAQLVANLPFSDSSALLQLTEAESLYAKHGLDKEKALVQLEILNRKDLEKEALEAAYRALLEAYSLDKAMPARMEVYADYGPFLEKTQGIPAAVTLYQQALKELDALKLTLDVRYYRSVFQYLLSTLYLTLRDFNQALLYSNAAVRNAQKLPRSERNEYELIQASIFNAYVRGIKALEEGQLPIDAAIRQAEQTLDQANTYQNAAIDKELRGGIYSVLSILYLINQDIEAAMEAGRRNIRFIRKNLKNRKWELADALLNLGVNFKDARFPKSWPQEKRERYRRNFQDSAVFYHQAAIEVLEGLSRQTYLAQAYKNLGNLYFERKRDFKKALECFHLGLEALFPNVDDTKSTDLIDWQAQAYCLDRMIAVSSLRGKLDALIELYKAQPDTSWVPIIEQHLAQAEALLRRHQSYVSEEGLGQIAAYQSQYVSEKVLQWIENHYFEAGMTQAENPLRMAHHTVERGVNARLLGSLQRSSAYRLGRVDSALVQEEKALKSRIAETKKLFIEARQAQQTQLVEKRETQLFELQRQYERMLQRMEQEAPEYYGLRHQQQIPDLSALQAQLDGQTAILQYYISNNNIWLFYIDREQSALHAFDLDPPSPQNPQENYASYFTQCVNDLRERLSNDQFVRNHRDSSLQSYRCCAYDLYKILLLDKVLQKPEIDQLLIIPFEKLSHLPFEVLLRDNQTGQHYGQLPYLIRDYAISYAYSASLFFQSMQQESRGGKGILGFAASYDEKPRATTEERLRNMRSRLSDLPGAQQELQKLKAQYPGDYYFAQSATEGQFKKAATQPYDVLHLAMHGLLDEANPLASSLVFTANDDSLEDDFVFAYELSQMDIPAALVVLSACETGHGRFQHGEGVASLARAFMYAGSPSLLVSLWPVSDASTAEMMPVFYEGLAQGLNKAKALQQAKLRYLEQAKGMNTHPFFWAAFVQLGNYEPIEIGPSSPNGLYIGLGIAAVVGLGLLLWQRRRK